MSTTDEQRLREALVAAIEPLRMYRAYGWPDRNRVIEHCENALAQQVPTPAVSDEQIVSTAVRYTIFCEPDEEDVVAFARELLATPTAATRKPAAPVDARDANAE